MGFILYRDTENSFYLSKKRTPNMHSESDLQKLDKCYSWLTQTDLDNSKAVTTTVSNAKNIYVHILFYQLTIDIKETFIGSLSAIQYLEGPSTIFELWIVQYFCSFPHDVGVWFDSPCPSYKQINLIIKQQLLIQSLNKFVI